jgi:hypothetical protein
MVNYASEYGIECFLKLSLSASRKEIKILEILMPDLIDEGGHVTTALIHD